MSKKLVCSVYDSKVGTYDKPMFFLTKGEAIRAWITGVNDPNTGFYAYPEDYSLMELGEYDEKLGSFTNHTAPINLGLAASYKKPLNHNGQPTEGKLQ